MIEKVVRIEKLSESDQTKEDLAYWLSKTPEERVAEVERLRREHHGILTPMLKVVRIIKMSTGEVIRDYPDNTKGKR